MRFRRLTDVVTRTPGLDEFRSNLCYAEEVLANSVERQLVTHQVVAVRRAEAAINYAQGPVANTVLAHTDMSGEQSIGCL